MQDCKILIVEDESIVAADLRLSLTHMGYTVTAIARTGEEALALVRDTTPDLVVMDVLLDGTMSGIAAAEAIRALSDVPIVFVSAHSDEDTVRRSRLVAAHGFLIKPFEPRQLQATIDMALYKWGMERVLRANEEMFRKLAETIPVGIFITQSDRTTYVNNEAARITGFEREELTGMQVRDVLHPDSLPHLDALLTAWHTDGTRILDQEIPLRTRTGETRWVSLSITDIDFAGEPRVLWAALDITDRKAADARIREQAAFLDVTRDAIVVRDLEGTIVFWNHAAERVYGWSPSAVIGRNMAEVLQRQDSTEWIRAYRAVIEHGEWTGELRHLTNDNREIFVESRWTMMAGSDEAPKYILMVNTDITEKKQLEAQFRRAQRLEIIGTLAGGIAHDLNNVLAPVSMAVSLLRIKLQDEQSQRILSTLESSVNRGSDIVRQVLTFARGVEGERVILSPKHVMREVERIIRETFPKSIEVSSDIPRDLWTISGDGTQLHQVLMNLCVNARDAMPEGGSLSLKAENITLDDKAARLHLGAKPGSYAVLSVTDTGTGIPPAILDKIFDPFFTTKEVGKGTGLGLSTVSGIVRSHGGFVTVYSEPGAGTSFRVYLPAAMGEEEPKADDLRTTTQTGSGETILVVDDETSIREITREALEENGYHALTARDGTEAVAVFAQKRSLIKAVMMDMMMPFMDGPSTIRALRRIDPQVRVIATSGLANKENLNEARVDAQAILQKPFTTERLLETLDSILTRGEEAG
jgi:hypothetical protein